MQAAPEVQEDIEARDIEAAGDAQVLSTKRTKMTAEEKKIKNREAQVRFRAKHRNELNEKQFLKRYENPDNVPKMRVISAAKYGVRTTEAPEKEIAPPVVHLKKTFLIPESRIGFPVKPADPVIKPVKALAKLPSGKYKNMSYMGLREAIINRYGSNDGEQLRMIIEIMAGTTDLETIQLIPDVSIYFNKGFPAFDAQLKAYRQKKNKGLPLAISTIEKRYLTLDKWFSYLHESYPAIGHELKHNAKLAAFARDVKEAGSNLKHAAKVTQANLLVDPERAVPKFPDIIRRVKDCKKLTQADRDQAVLYLKMYECCPLRDDFADIKIVQTLAEATDALQDYLVLHRDANRPTKFLPQLNLHLSKVHQPYNYSWPTDAPIGKDFPEYLETFLKDHPGRKFLFVDNKTKKQFNNTSKNSKTGEYVVEHKFWPHMNKILEIAIPANKEKDQVTMKDVRQSAATFLTQLYEPNLARIAALMNHSLDTHIAKYGRVTAAPTELHGPAIAHTNEDADEEVSSGPNKKTKEPLAQKLATVEEDEVIIPTKLSKRQAAIKEKMPEVKPPQAPKKKKQPSFPSFNVEGLMEKKTSVANQVLYLVKWLGYKYTDSTWEPSSALPKKPSTYKILEHPDGYTPPPLPTEKLVVQKN